MEPWRRICFGSMIEQGSPSVTDKNACSPHCPIAFYSIGPRWLDSAGGDFPSPGWRNARGGCSGRIAKPEDRGTLPRMSPRPAVLCSFFWFRIHFGDGTTTPPHDAQNCTLYGIVGCGSVSRTPNAGGGSGLRRRGPRSCRRQALPPRRGTLPSPLESSLCRRSPRRSAPANEGGSTRPPLSVTTRGRLRRRLLDFPRVEETVRLRDY